MFEDSVVLISGGTGSFGHAMVDHLLRGSCKEIRVFSRDETKQEAMRIQIGDERVRFFIGDVRDRESIRWAMSGVDFVFHAAALKQVPSCEFFPLEAVQTNILGSSNILELAIEERVRSVVCLSTDKAVYPINSMGATKMLMEKVALAASRKAEESGTIVSCVRYGNVMYSRGSVLPLFVNQILDKEPITITEPSMTRFLLPLTEAVKLVDFALRNAKQGDVFIRKAPASTVEDLVAGLQRVFSTDNPTKTMGVRHGEKIYETLASAEEMIRAEDMGDYFRVPMDRRSLNYSSYTVAGTPEATQVDHYTSHNTERLDAHAVEKLLLTLPEIREALGRYQVEVGA